MKYELKKDEAGMVNFYLIAGENLVKNNMSAEAAEEVLSLNKIKRSTVIPGFEIQAGKLLFEGTLFEERKRRTND